MHAGEASNGSIRDSADSTHPPFTDWRLVAQGGLPFILIAALVQGWALYGLHHAVNTPHWPATDSAWLLALYAVAVFVPLTVQILASSIQSRTAGVILAGVAIAFFYFGWHHGANVAGDAKNFISRGEFLPIGFELGVWWLLILPFIQCRLAEGTWRPDYGSLFSTAWRNKITLAEAAAFTGLFWLLLFLWQALFAMLGIGFFKALFEEPIFVYPVTALTFGVALHLIGSVERLTRVVLEQALNVLKWLALIAGLILALFTLALIFKLPGMISSGERAISAAWLLWLVAVTVLLVNAAFRDGAVHEPYPRWIGVALRCVIPLTVVISFTAVYALYVRVDAYGLTTERVWAFIVATAACVYAVGYALAARRGSPWMAGVARVNVGVAWLLIAMIALALTPVLSPYRLAANSQFEMAQQAIDEARPLNGYHSTPLHYLRFRAGEYGQVRLRELATLEDHPRAADIRKAAEAMLAQENPWGRPPSDVRSRLANLSIHPGGAALDEQLQARIEDDLQGELRHLGGAPDQNLAGVFIDLNADAGDEFVLLAQGAGVAYQRHGEDWRRIGLMHPSQFPDQDALAAALASGDVRTEPATWRELAVGRVRFRVQ